MAQHAASSSQENGDAAVVSVPAAGRDAPAPAELAKQLAEARQAAADSVKVCLKPRKSATSGHSKLQQNAYDLVLCQSPLGLCDLDILHSASMSAAAVALLALAKVLTDLTGM